MVAIEKAILVAAHPDDEILWFSSILNRCNRVVVCFGESAKSDMDWDAGRATLMDNYPLAKAKFLRVRQSDAYEAANWRHPRVDASGLQLRQRSELYDENAATLLRLLEAEVAGESVVFTHNPWGEYGNEEHVQVFRILQNLQQRHGFHIFVNGYVSNRSVNLMAASAEMLHGQGLLLHTDSQLVTKLKQLYVRYGCWTWWAGYQWPRHEVFYQIMPPTRDHATGDITVTPPLNEIRYNFKRSLARKFLANLLSGPVKDSIKTSLSRVKSPNS